MSVLKYAADIDKEVIDLLQAKQITKTTDFISKDAEDIVQQTGIPYKDVVYLRKIVLAQNAALPISGTDLYTQALSTASLLSTGINSLDELLDGGLYTGEVTELIGDIAAGKTQVCHSVTGTTAQESSQTVLYIDTGAVFSAHRVIQLLNTGNRKLSDREVLSRVSVCRVWNLYDLLEVMENLRKGLRDVADPFYSRLKLVVVDNIASVVYPILGGGSFSENQGMLNNLGQTLKQMAVEFSLAVLVTNNVVKGQNNMMVASLGRLWSHVPHLRVIIHLSGQEVTPGQRNVTVLKSNRIAPGTTRSMFITADGPVT